MASLDKNEAYKLISRQHHEFAESINVDRRMLDSLEGGQTYRDATYGTEIGFTPSYPIYNLKRHKRERRDPRLFANTGDQYTGSVTLGASFGVVQGFSRLGIDGRGDGGTDPYSRAGEDDFEMRRARTPVPAIVGHIIGDHRDRIYHREVTRDGPQALKDFWKDVDGKGTSIDDCIKSDLAPHFLAAGFVDLLFDNPPKPDNAEVVSIKDQKDLRLDDCRVSVVQPENLRWWKLDALDRYVECVTREVRDDEEGRPKFFYRHWTTTSTTLYDKNGEVVEATRPHGFKRLPIVRVFDTRKRGKKNRGQSAYEGIAERQREVYNLMSELMVGDTLQAFPLLQTPEDFCKADQQVPIGPQYTLPMKKIKDGAGYQPWQYLDPPKGSADSIRKNIANHIMEAYRMACLVAPSTTDALAGSPVDQSGIAKEIDFSSLNNFLSQRAKGLYRLELAIVEGWALVTGGNKDAATIHYPSSFYTHQTAQQAALWQALVMLYEGLGRLPEAEKKAIKDLLRGILPGLQDEQYEEFDDEIDKLIDTKAEMFQQALEDQKMKMVIDRANAAPTDAQGDGKSSRTPTSEATGQPERHSVAGLSSLTTPGGGMGV